MTYPFKYQMNILRYIIEPNCAGKSHQRVYGRCCEFHVEHVYDNKAYEDDYYHRAKLAKWYYHHYDFINPTIVQMTGPSIRYQEIQ